MRTAAVAAPEPGGHHDVVRGLHPGRHRRRQAAELGLRRVCVRYGRPERGGGAERRVSASSALTRRPRPPGPALPCGPRAAGGVAGLVRSGPVPSAWSRGAELSRTAGRAGPACAVLEPRALLSSAAPPPTALRPAACAHSCCVSAGRGGAPCPRAGQRRAPLIAWSAALDPLGLRGPFGRKASFPFRAICRVTDGPLEEVKSR